MLADRQPGDRRIKFLSEGLDDRGSKPNQRGHLRIDLVSKPGPPGYDATDLHVPLRLGASDKNTFPAYIDHF